jgi:hypothetical protein
VEVPLIVVVKVLFIEWSYRRRREEPGDKDRVVRDSLEELSDFMSYPYLSMSEKE